MYTYKALNNILEFLKLKEKLAKTSQEDSTTWEISILLQFIEFVFDERCYF